MKYGCEEEKGKLMRRDNDEKEWKKIVKKKVKEKNGSEWVRDEE